jgi:hypothetical protein
MQRYRIIYYSILSWLLYMFRAIISKHVQQPRNNRVINYPTQLHLVGHFYKNTVISKLVFGSSNYHFPLLSDNVNGIALA